MIEGLGQARVLHLRTPTQASATSVGMPTPVRLQRAEAAMLRGSDAAGVLPALP
jgi:hypothetical protein